MKIHSNTFPAAKFRLNQSNLFRQNAEKTIKIPDKTVRAKSQFNIAHFSVQSKPKHLTDANNIEIRQLIN